MNQNRWMKVAHFIFNEQKCHFRDDRWCWWVKVLEPTWRRCCYWNMAFLRPKASRAQFFSEKWWPSIALFFGEIAMGRRNLGISNVVFLRLPGKAHSWRKRLCGQLVSQGLWTERIKAQQFGDLVWFGVWICWSCLGFVVKAGDDVLFCCMENDFEWLRGMMFDVIDFPDANPKCLAFSSSFCCVSRGLTSVFGHLGAVPSGHLGEIEDVLVERGHMGFNLGKKWQEQVGLSYTIPYHTPISPRDNSKQFKFSNLILKIKRIQRWRCCQFGKMELWHDYAAGEVGPTPVLAWSLPRFQGCRLEFSPRWKPPHLQGVFLTSWR